MSFAFDDPLLGKTIAQRYRLISRLGAGGSASVYLARHVLIDRLSAIKLLNPELGTNPSYKDRFLREARAVNRINHPNIVEINDYGESDGRVYLVMEYIPGETLVKALERGPLGWRRAVGIGLQIASALGRAHQMGVIHRDLKPGNILLVAQREGDQAKLTDFGVAKMLDASTLTNSAVALGTPGYVAPEYREYGSIDSRSDLFSLGVVLYETTCRVLPFDPVYQANCVSSALPPPVRLAQRAPDVPSFFDEIVMTLLACDPDDRPRDGYEAFDLLRRLAEREGVVAPLTPMSIAPRGDVGPASLGREPTSAGPNGPRKKAGPHLTTIAFDRIAPLCLTALGTLLDASGRAPATADRVHPSIDECRKLVDSVGSIARMVAADSEEREAIEVRGRALRADLGERLDEVAREHSKTLGWAGTIAERTYAVQTARISGEHAVPFVDAMVWEQAALEQEEDRARESADEMAAQMSGLQVEVDRQNERIEREMLVVTARLEGRIAALRSIALEAAMALEQSGAAFGLSTADLWPQRA